MAGASVINEVDASLAEECPRVKQQDSLEGERSPKHGAPQELDEPHATAAKRARTASSVSELDAVAARFEDAIGKARVLLAPSEEGKEKEEEEEEEVMDSALKSLASEVEDALQKQRAAEARWHEEQAALVTAKAKLKALELAQERAASAQSRASPALEELERVAAEVVSACCKARQPASRVMATDTAEEMVELDQEGAEPSLAAAFQRLVVAERQKQELAGERKLAEAARLDAEARLAVCERRLEEQRCRQAEAEAAQQRRLAEAEGAEEVQAAVLQGEVDKLEIAAAAAGSALAEQRAAAPPEEAQQLAALEKRIEELQKLCEEEECKARELEAKCAAAEAHVPGKVHELEVKCAAADPHALTEGKEPEPVSAENGSKSKLDVMNPKPFLNSRAAQRLCVSNEDVPEVAGEYRLVQVGENGWPMYKAARPEAVFLLWSSREGGRWVFSADALGADSIFARSLQLAWTTLPDELMASSWTRAAWGTQGPRARISILRG